MCRFDVKTEVNPPKRGMNIEHSKYRYEAVSVPAPVRCTGKMLRLMCTSRDTDSLP